MLFGRKTYQSKLDTTIACPFVGMNEPMPSAQGGLLVIVQARLESQRFPHKILQPLCGQPMLLWQLSRLSKIQIPHTLVVASPDTEMNVTQLAPLLRRHGYVCEVVPGDPDDVLGRFAFVARLYKAQEIVRLTGDCPLLDPGVIDALIAYHHWHILPRPDLTGIGPDWPDGMDCEIFSRKALETAHAEATIPRHREHVTSYMYDHPRQFVCDTLPCPFDVQALQFSVDTEDDYALTMRILKKTLPRTGIHFTWQDLWLTLELNPPLMQQVLARPVRNSAYVAQVAAETGEPVKTWKEVRYRA